MRIVVRGKSFAMLKDFAEPMFRKLLGGRIKSDTTARKNKMDIDDGSEIFFVSDEQNYQAYALLWRDYEIRIKSI